ncbi:MAG: dipeptidyl carboxypeptidase II, partial [Sphingomonadales bacterium]|nr:dipeptidyl carboxypeptidase II [Sphingomonadales bacterium]
MNRRILLAATALACTGLSLAGCATTTPPVAAVPAAPAPDPAPAPAARPVIPVATGIFAAPSTLPYQAPPFDRIRDEDYLPGFEQAIAIKRAEVMAIANDPSAPTFANTIVALERSGQMLGRVARAFSARQGSNTNPVLDATQSKVSPLLAALDNDIMLNTALFARIRALYEARATLGLDAEQGRVLEL